MRDEVTEASRRRILCAPDRGAAAWVLWTLAVLILAAPTAYAGSLVGALYVTTDPAEAAVYVNGELKGVSPCGVRDVGVGEVEVTAEKQGFETAGKTVQVEADRTTRVDLALRRLANVGSIAVLVDPPGSEIELDRVPRGSTPAVLINVPAGTHRVVVSAAGFQSLHSTVAVAPNRQFVLKGRLVPTEAPPAEQAGVADLDKLGVVDEDTIPATSEMPEERAFEPVRELLSQRRYEEALRKLDEMAADQQTQEYARRIGRERRMTRRIQEVVNFAYAQLEKAQGRDYVLSLRKGIRFTGKLVDVTDTHAVISAAGGEKRIALSSIGPEQIVRLASYRLDPGRPANRVSFALVYAAEGEFQKAYDELRAAAKAGYDITPSRSYVDSEHLWAAAVQKEHAERLRARMLGPRPPQALSEDAGPVRLLVDTYRGEDLPEGLSATLKQSGFDLHPLAHPFTERDVEGPALLVIYDPGAGRPVPAYDRQELQSIMDFIRRGGGLLFVGAARPVPRQDAKRPQPVPPHPFGPLLRWFGILTRPDELSVSENAPEGYPEEHAVCFPVARHPVTYGVRRVILPVSSPSLAVRDGAWVLLRANQFVGSEWAGEVAPPVAALRIFGDGRILIIANMPLMNKSAWRGSPFYANDADKLLLNGLLWLSEPTRSLGRKDR